MEFKAKTFDELTTRELYEILKARCLIFTVEQKIICVDPDGMDYQSLHCFLEDGGNIIAYLRAFVEDEKTGTVKIGRVLSVTHGEGHGTKLMRLAIPEIKNRLGCQKISVHAQKHAESFYALFGFKPVSDDFLEEGVLHVAMELDAP